MSLMEISNCSYTAPFFFFFFALLTAVGAFTFMLKIYININRDIGITISRFAKEVCWRNQY